MFGKGVISQWNSQRFGVIVLSEWSCNIFRTGVFSNLFYNVETYCDMGVEFHYVGDIDLTVEFYNIKIDLVVIIQE